MYDNTRASLKSPSKGGLFVDGTLVGTSTEGLSWNFFLALSV